jgi:hypothetical protein
LEHLGRTAFEQGDFARAAALWREDLAMQQELAPTRPLGAAAFLGGIALLAVVRDQPAPAARLFGARATQRERAEDSERAERKLIEPWIAAARAALGEDAFTREWQAGRALPIDVALAEAGALLAAWTWPAPGDPATNRGARA